MPASPRTDVWLAKAEPIRDDDSFSRITELISGGKKATAARRE